MAILALAPEQNRGTFYWETVDVRSKPLENSGAGILSALRGTSVASWYGYQLTE